MKTYSVSVPYRAERLVDTGQQEAIRQVWEVAPDAPDMHGTLAINALSANFTQPDQLPLLSPTTC